MRPVDRDVGRATAVLIGADTVLADGSVINGRPSLAVAQAAARAGVPVYVVAERAKVDAELSVGSAEIEEGFDVVPGELIRARCCHGLLRAASPCSTLQEVR